MMLRSLLTIAAISLAVASAEPETVDARRRDAEVIFDERESIKFDAELSDKNGHWDMDEKFKVEKEIEADFEEDWDDDRESHDEGCPCEKHKKEREEHPRVCGKIPDDRVPALRVTSPHVSPGGPSFWETCTWQAITFDASGYPDFELAYAQLFGGDGIQVNLKPVKAGYGIAKIFVPKQLTTGLYRARVILRRYCGKHEPCQEIAAVGPWFEIKHSAINCEYNK